MIPRAVEALKKPSAKLTAEEIAAADKISTEIGNHVDRFMAFYGCEFSCKETRPNVLAEVIQRVKDAGYSPEWQFLYEKHPLNVAVSQLVGFKINLTPSDEAYRAVRL